MCRPSTQSRSAYVCSTSDIAPGEEGAIVGCAVSTGDADGGEVESGCGSGCKWPRQKKSRPTRVRALGKVFNTFAMTQLLKANHRSNWLLAALEPEDLARLEPYLEIVDLALGDVLYDTGDAIRYAYFPHDAIISLVNVMEDGATVEIGVFGREGVLGLLSALFTREAFGRYVVQMARHRIAGALRAPERDAKQQPSTAAVDPALR